MSACASDALVFLGATGDLAYQKAFWRSTRFGAAGHVAVELAPAGAAASLL